MIFSKALLATFLISLPLATLADEKHTSTAIIEIYQNESNALNPPIKSPNFIANEIASMAMGEIIAGAASDLQIDAEIIRNSLKVTRVKGTDLAKVTVTLEDQEQAKAIVEGVIRSYVSSRGSRERQMAETQLSNLDDELILQGDLVQQLHKELTILIQQYGIPCFEGDESFHVGGVENQLYFEERQRLLRLESEKEKHQARLHILKNAAPGKELLAAATIDIPNNPATRLYEESQSLPAEKKDFNQLTDRVNKAVSDLTVILKSNLQMIDQEITLASSSVEKFKTYAIDLSLKQNVYNQARNDFERARELYEKLAMRQQEARVALKMPKTILTYHQKPE